MDKTKVTLKLEQWQIDHFKKQLGYIRCWIQGYEAGSGKPGPHAQDELRRLQILLETAK